MEFTHATNFASRDRPTQDLCPLHRTVAYYSTPALS